MLKFLVSCYIMATLLLSPLSNGQDTPRLLQPLVVYTTPASLIYTLLAGQHSEFWSVCWYTY